MSGTQTIDQERPSLLSSVVVVLSALAGGLTLLYAVLEQGPTGRGLYLDVAVGSVCCVLLGWRHRAPVAIAVTASAASAVVATAGAANMFALFAVARRRPLPTALALAVLNVVAGLVFAAVYPGNGSWFLTATVNVALSAAAVAWGALVRAQRRLVRSLEDRALRAEAFERLRAEQIRSAERAELAREMHDVVAHRVSLVALHAGGLEVSPPLPVEEVRESARLIRRSAQDALDELRVVVGALREDATASGAVPSLKDLEPLVADSAAAGQPVELELHVTPDAELPPWLGRTAYRIVREALTNAHKHAPGAVTTVHLTGGPGQGLTLEVQNLRGAETPATAVTGAGAGLLGLTERVALAGGTLSHGPTPPGYFTIRAELPWPAARQAVVSGGAR